MIEKSLALIVLFTTSVALAQGAPGPAANLTVTDHRPASDKKTKFLSLMLTNCDYSVRRLGDEMSEPQKITVLKQDLEQRLGAAADGKNLDVSRWSIYFNNSALLRGITYAGGGLVGAVAGEHIKKMGSRCAREKSEGGWYEPADLTTPYSPLISEFTGTYDGKPLTIRVVYSPEVELRGKFKNNEADLAALNATLHKTADAIVAALAQ